jgi:hypothetical protein
MARHGKSRQQRNERTKTAAGKTENGIALIDLLEERIPSLHPAVSVYETSKKSRLKGETSYSPGEATSSKLTKAYVYTPNPSS